MPEGGDGEVDGQDRIGIHEDVELGILPYGHLLCGKAALAEEAAAMLHGILAHLGARGDHAGGIELQLQCQGWALRLVHGAHAHTQQVAVAAAGVVPEFQLAVEKTSQRTFVVVGQGRGVELLARLQL